MRLLGSVFVFILFCFQAQANQGQSTLCPDTFGWKYGNFFANCVSEHTEVLALKLPTLITKCPAPKYSEVNRAYTTCLQRNFDRARHGLQLTPRTCAVAKVEQFHPHIDQKWASCVRKQILDIEAAIQ